MSTGTSSSSEPRLRGAVLAAGRGNRMHAPDRWVPKTLLPVAGRPILAHQLRLLRSISIRRVVVLVGHLKEQVIDYLETTRGLGLDVEFVVQPSLNGAGGGLLCLRPNLDGPFVLFLGDILIHAVRLGELVEPLLRGECAAVLGVTMEPDAASLGKNFRVDLGPDGRVRRVVEKPASGGPALKGCGVYAFTPRIFAAVEQTRPNASGEVGITESIQTLIELGHEVRTAVVSDWDMNLTTSDDLAAANRRFLAQGRDSDPCRCD